MLGDVLPQNIRFSTQSSTPGLWHVQSWQSRAIPHKSALFGIESQDTKSRASSNLRDHLFITIVHCVQCHVGMHTSKTAHPISSRCHHLIAASEIGHQQSRLHNVMHVCHLTLHHLMHWHGQCQLIGNMYAMPVS